MAIFHLENYPLVAKEYASLMALEEKMDDPEAILDQAAWEEMCRE